MQHLSFLLQFEFAPYTQHGQELANMKDKYLAKYKEVRAGLRKATARVNTRAKQAAVANATTTKTQPSPSQAPVLKSTNESVRTPSPSTKAPSSSAPGFSAFGGSTQSLFSSSSSPLLNEIEAARQLLTGGDKKGGEKGKSTGLFGQPSFGQPASAGTPAVVGAFGSPPPQGGLFGPPSTSAPSNEFLAMQGTGFNLSSPSTTTTRSQEPSSSSLFPPNTSPWTATGFGGYGSASTTTGFSGSPAKAPTREQDEAQLLSVLARLGFGHVNLEDLGKLNPPDAYEQEMELMAEVRAYFHISYKVRCSEAIHGFTYALTYTTEDNRLRSHVYRPHVLSLLRLVSSIHADREVRAGYEECRSSMYGVRR